MTIPDWIAPWLEKLSLDGWANVTTIFGAICAFIVSIVALRMQSQELRAQCEALPVSVAFGSTLNSQFVYVAESFPSVMRGELN